MHPVRLKEGKESSKLPTTIIHFNIISVHMIINIGALLNITDETAHQQICKQEKNYYYNADIKNYGLLLG